jgi:hypothetical protein
MDASKIRLKIQEYLDQGHTATKQGDDALLSQPNLSFATTGLLGTLMGKKKVNITYDKPILLKEKCVYRSLNGDVFEIVKLDFVGNDLDAMTVKIVSAYDEIQDLVYPRSGLDFNSMRREDLKHYLGTILFLESVTLLYYRLDDKKLKTVSGISRVLDAVGWSSGDPSVMTSGIRDSCPQDLQHARDELAALKASILTGNVNKLDLVPLSTTAYSGRVKIEANVGGKRVELYIRNNDTIETQVPFISGAHLYDMADAGLGVAGPAVNLQTIQCKVIHIDHLTKPKAKVLLEIKGTTRRFEVSVDPTLYFWKHISLLDKYFGKFKSNLQKQMTRKGGYTSKTTSFSPKKNVKKTSKKHR